LAAVRRAGNRLRTGALPLSRRNYILSRNGWVMRRIAGGAKAFWVGLNL
jgi:hypothetical protein